VGKNQYDHRFFDYLKHVVLKDLKEQGLVIKIEEHMHSVGHSERSGAVVEPYLSTQWFKSSTNCLRHSKRSSPSYLPA
jgi:valyl-tRNA synthetase